MTGDRMRLIAFYLPQFFPIPENDEWLGPGYTEWVNVAAARQLFRGHQQPKLPGRLGFYDLRLPETRAQQADLARQAGVHAFCYWHYWFGDGREVLTRPLDEVGASGEPDFPFCVGWANDSWTGKWRGQSHRVLIHQTYPSLADHEAHFYRLLPFFHDVRYVRVDGAPLFYVRRPLSIPDIEWWTDLWRELASRNGLPDMHFVGETQWRDATRRVPASLVGLDATVDIGIISAYFGATRLPAHGRRPACVAYDTGHFTFPRLAIDGRASYPCTLPNWDNTPKYGRRGLVIQGSTLELFASQLQYASSLVVDREPAHRIVFLKSWNEWSEGCYIEPDRMTGGAHLEAIRRVVGY